MNTQKIVHDKSIHISVILFGILGNYLDLHIWENISLKFGKISTKIHEIGKIKAIFGLGMTTVILLPAHPASFAHKFLFQRVPVSPRMQ